MTARAQPWLGTLVEVRVSAPGDAAADAAITAAFASVARIHRLMSFHESGSELSRINRDARRSAVPVGQDTCKVLVAGLRVSSASDGAFDYTVAGCLARHGFLPGDEAIPRGASWRDVEIDERNRTVRFHAPLQIDLGGIAKGYAVDRAIAALKNFGVESACVNAGGDLRLFGPVPQAIHIRHPGMPGRLLHACDLARGSIATSAAYFNAASPARPGLLPIVDPAKDAPINDMPSVSVVASSCMIADALTKVVTLRRDDAAPALAAFKAAALVVGTNNRVACSDPRRFVALPALGSRLAA